MRTSYRVVGCLAVCVAVLVLIAPSAYAIDWPFMRCVEDDDFVWRSPAVALDPSTGEPRFVYAERAIGGGYNIMFCWWALGEWQDAVEVAQVHIGDGEGVYLYDISLALAANGDPGIAYAYSNLVDSGNPPEKYIYVHYTCPSTIAWTGGWISTRVLGDGDYVLKQLSGDNHPNGASISCAFKGNGDGDGLADGYPAIAVAVSKETTNHCNYVYYIEYDGSDWDEVNVVDSVGPDSDVYEPNEGSISLAMDLSQTTYFGRIAYDVIFSGEDREITYASRDSQGDWDTETIDGGKYVSLALDPTDDYAPAVASKKNYGDDSGDIWYYKKSNPYSWSTDEKVQEHGQALLKYPSLAIDKNTGVPTVAWTGGSSPSYYVDAKVRQGTDDWEEIGDVSKGANGQLAPSLALHPVSGRPYVAAASNQHIYIEFDDDEPGRENWLGVAYLGSFNVENSSGVVASLGCFGDLVVSSFSIETPLAPDSQASEFIVKNPSGTPLYLALIDDDGTLEIIGEHSQNVENITLSSNDGEFIFKNDLGDVVCLIDESGNLELMGNLE